MAPENPSKVCDIVLKGGITSGVVYPLALVSLAQEYRFANIGGTSAGAIAAAAAAAAEYGRPIAGAGFERLAKIPAEIGPSLLSMFQPAPRLRPLYRMFLGALKAEGGFGRVTAIATAAVLGYWESVGLGALAGLLVAAAAAVAGSAGFLAFGLLAALVGAVLGLGLRLVRAVTRDLPDNDFGVCPGLRQPGAAEEGFTDYLTRLVDEASGRASDGQAPLTFGDLALPSGQRPPIELAMITTSLMEKRPYTLPMASGRFVFEREEWANIFPERIMAHLTKVCDRYEPACGEPGDYYHFPDRFRLPIVVAARMSLSFPLLISAVPLYRRDFTMAEQAEQHKLRRCLFSDGGLSSNFPIHFFDKLLPGNPTFAISLDAFDKRRSRNGNVWLPRTARGGIEQPVLPFAGIGGFLMRLVDAAKDWQDSLQSTLPGYRERIAHVALKPDEGGLNVAMDAATVERLVGYGKQAGDILREEFDLDLHRWRRFVVAAARMEETLDDLATAYDELPGGVDAYPAFLARYADDPKQYKQSAPVVRAMTERLGALAALGRAWRARPMIRDGEIPKPDTALRITPKP